MVESRSWLSDNWCVLSNGRRSEDVVLHVWYDLAAIERS